MEGVLQVVITEVPLYEVRNTVRVSILTTPLLASIPPPLLSPFSWGILSTELWIFLAEDGQDGGTDRSRVRLSFGGGWRRWLRGMRVGPFAVTASFPLSLPAAAVPVPAWSVDTAASTGLAFFILGELSTGGGAGGCGVISASTTTWSTTDEIRTRSFADVIDTEM